MLTIISSMSMSICNCFHAGQANRIKYKLFRGYSSSTLSFERNILTRGHEISSSKLESLGQPCSSEDFMILVCAVLIQSQNVTDRRTDGRLDDG